MLLKFFSEKQELFARALDGRKTVPVSFNLSGKGTFTNINKTVHLTSSNADYRKRGTGGIS